jgi:F-type H+-transporting ATPase subunit b
MIRCPRPVANVLLFLGAVALPSVALGVDEHGAHEALKPMPGVDEGLVTGITAMVVFALVFAVLAVKVWPVIATALDERASKIRSEIEAAELAQKQARAALEQYEKNLAEARAEAQKMLDTARAQQLALAAENKVKAEADLAQLRERATRDIETAKRAALSEIYEESARLATSIASKILQREVTAGDQSRLVEESLRELAGTRG